MPSPQKVRMVDAVLVALMEHGVTPATLAARLVLDASPDALQGALAAGTLAIGSRFLGTIEQVAEFTTAILIRVGNGQDLESAAEATVAEVVARGDRVPGVGHNLHATLDPRVERLLEIARAEGFARRHVEALELAQLVLNRMRDKPLLANAAGAIGAIIGDLGYEARQARAFAAVARPAGVFAHLKDEQSSPVSRTPWRRLPNRPSVLPQREMGKESGRE